MSAPWLGEALRAGGLPVIEEPDCMDRGTGGLFTPLGVLLHHTAGSANGNLPSLGIVRDGRSDLQGPLSQLMLARDGAFHFVAAGRANHAGVGSAWFVPGGDGNRYLIGIEAESTGVRDDWTDAQRVNYPRGVAALLRWMGKNELYAIGHKEWAPTRKVDPAFWDMNAFRGDVRNWLNGREEDIVASIEDLRNVLREFNPAGRKDVGFMRDQIARAIGFDPAADPAKISAVVARRTDLGFARDQFASAFGIDPSAAPDYSELTPEELADRAPLRRCDLDEIVSTIVGKVVEALTPSDDAPAA